MSHIDNVLTKRFMFCSIKSLAKAMTNQNNKSLLKRAKCRAQINEQ